MGLGSPCRGLLRAAASDFVVVDEAEAGGFVRGILGGSSNLVKSQNAG